MIKNIFFDNIEHSYKIKKKKSRDVPDNPKLYDKNYNSNLSFYSLKFPQVHSNDMNSLLSSDDNANCETGSSANSPSSSKDEQQVKEEKWWQITIQVSIPFLLAGIGTIGAGIILGNVEVKTIFFYGDIFKIFQVVPSSSGYIVINNDSDLTSLWKLRSFLFSYLRCSVLKETWI